ncbi:MAG TPA: hypothetical protein VFS67_34220 [Polyangiaceae bacterium]|nr:hypothetical protein [Polyangiaceae bacterium]
MLLSALQSLCSSCALALALAEPGLTEQTRGGAAILGLTILFMLGLSLLTIGGSIAVIVLLARRWLARHPGAGARVGAWLVGGVAGVSVIALCVQPLFLLSLFLAAWVADVFY